MATKLYDPGNDGLTVYDTGGGAIGFLTVKYAKVDFTFPSVTSEAGLRGFEVVLHTGTDPDVVANRLTDVYSIADPTATSVALRIPAAVGSSITNVKASVRAVYTWGKGNWGTLSSTATIGVGTTYSAATFPTLVSGDYLTNNGTAVSWGAISQVPSTSGHSNGEVLQIVSGSPAWQNPTGSSAVAVAWFGSGRQGNLTISSGTTTLAADAYYNNVTISGTAVLNVANYRLHVAGTLDLSNAPSGAIVCNPVSNATNGTGASAGALGTATGANSMPSGTSGGNGANGSLTSGNSPSLGSGNSAQQIGGQYYGLTAQGGTGTGSAGGLANPSAGTKYYQDHFEVFIAKTSGATNFTALQAGTGGPGGGSGGGDSVNSGGGGGGGGAGAGTVWIAASVIARGTNSNTSIIKAVGGNGGNGATPSTGNCGGGAGGAGGGGGLIMIAYGSITGSTITNALDVSSGTGGNGGNGVGTGKGGGGGGCGGGGAILVFNLGAGSSYYVDTTAPTAGDGGQSTGTGTSGHQNVSRGNL